MRRGRNSDKVLMGVKFYETTSHLVILHRYANKKELKSNPRIVGTTMFYNIYPSYDVIDIFPSILGMVIKDFMSNKFDINRKGRRFQEHFMDHADIIVNMYVNAWISHIEKKMQDADDALLIDSQVFSSEKSLSEKMSVSMEQAELFPTVLFTTFESRARYAQKQRDEALKNFPHASVFWGILMRNMHKSYRNIQSAIDHEDWEAVKLKLMCGFEEDERRILAPPGRKKSERLKFIGMALLAEEMRVGGCEESYEMLFNNQAIKTAKSILKSIPIRLKFKPADCNEREGDEKDENSVRTEPSSSLTE